MCESVCGNSVSPFVLAKSSSFRAPFPPRPLGIVVYGSEQVGRHVKAFEGIVECEGKRLWRIESNPPGDQNHTACTRASWMTQMSGRPSPWNK